MSLHHNASAKNSTGSTKNQKNQVILFNGKQRIIIGLQIVSFGDREDIYVVLLQKLRNFIILFFIRIEIRR